MCSWWKMRSVDLRSTSYKVRFVLNLRVYQNNHKKYVFSHKRRYTSDTVVFRHRLWSHDWRNRHSRRYGCSVGAWIRNSPCYPQDHRAQILVMFSTTTVATLLTTWYSDIGSGLTTGITAILVGLGALLVLGFVTRHVIRKITGRKF